jgi:hypothetical protein
MVIVSWEYGIVEIAVGRLWETICRISGKKLIEEDMSEKHAEVKNPLKNRLCESTCQWIAT